MKLPLLTLLPLSCSVPLLIFSGLSHAESENNKRLSLGGGVSVAAKYQGSDKVEASPITHLSYDFGNGFIASSTEGVGFNYAHPLDNGITLFAGTSFSYQQKRKDEDELKGMGEIKGSVFNKLDVGIDLNHYVAFHAGTNIMLSERDNGANYYLSASVPVLKMNDHEVSLKTTGYYFDKKYNQTYFGVTETQSKNSKFGKYSPKAGFGQIDSGVEWAYSINKKWSFSSFLGASHLVGDAADSPIVKQKTSLQTYITGVYTF